MKFFLFCIYIFVLTANPLIGQKFKFIVWGDSQFQNPETFERIVHETELLKPDFVLHVGDMIHGYTYNVNAAHKQWMKFKKQIEPLTVPFYPTPGNHDVTTKEIQPAYLETWGEDKLYYSFDYLNNHFIVLNAFHNQNFDSVSMEQFSWLKKDLEKNNNSDNIFVTIHSPLHLNKSFNWSYVHNLLKQYPVRAVFTGHYHYYEYRKIDEIEYFCLNSSGNMRLYNPYIGYFHHFLQVSVDDNKIDYAVLGDGKIFPKDFVSVTERERAQKFFNENSTIILSSASQGEKELSYILENRSTEVLNYSVSWETDDYSWRFEPWGYNTILPPNEKKELIFKYDFPKEIDKSNLPKLKIESPYTTSTGILTSAKHYANLFIPPTCTVKNVNAKITFDGNVEEKIWEESLIIHNLFIDKKMTSEIDKTKISIFYDDEYIYVGVLGSEPKPENLSAFAYGDIPLVFGDDDFELYFDTNRDMKTFFRLMVNPKGTVLSSSPKGRFTFNFDVKTFIGKDFWSAEFIIPFKELETSKPNIGDAWGFNVRRHRQQAEDIQSDWSKMANHPPYEPEYFGIIIFE